jgi:hypothetical protein
MRPERWETDKDAGRFGQIANAFSSGVIATCRTLTRVEVGPCAADAGCGGSLIATAAKGCGSSLS